jgi:cellulose synthase/poly-beta-1,6-N-acetylglucosamine synthase-like glycosyltransferase
MMLGEAVFWSSLGFIFYAYCGYPLILWGLTCLRSRDVRKGETPASVSLVITAYNEERRIREKIENSLKQDYPSTLLEIIVASDASTDHTDSIVTSYRSAGVRLVRAPERKGKEHAQKCAIDTACGHILVFSDVATVLEPNGIRSIVKSFSDPTVG